MSKTVHVKSTENDFLVYIRRFKSGTIPEGYCFFCGMPLRVPFQVALFKFPKFQTPVCDKHAKELMGNIKLLTVE